MALSMEIALLSIVGFFIVYPVLVSVAALLGARKKTIHPVRFRKFAIVVPAYNEERSIAGTVKNLRAIDYPSSLFHVAVIADNCTDQTASKARQEGARVYERFNSELRGKGYALQWGLEMLRSSGEFYEGFVVIDADSRAEQNFLSVMNEYLELGYDAVQAADLVVPNAGSWSSEVSRIALTLYNFVLPLGRSVLGCSAGLRGNGMCFSERALTRVPWQAHSLTEDAEYGFMLLEHGIVVRFAPETSVRAVMPSRAVHAESQRLRWEGGRLMMVKKFLPRMVRLAVMKPALKHCDAFIDLMTPAFVNLVGLVLLVIAVKMVTGNDPDGLPVLYWNVLLGIAFVYVVLGLTIAKADFTLYKAVLYLPVYIMWKLQLYGKLVYKGMTKEWVRTTRE